MYFHRKDAKSGGDKKGGHRKEGEPAAPPTTSSIYPADFRMAENITKKDRQKLEKILANIEYAEAHNDDEEGDKLRDRLKIVNEEARARAAHRAERDAERTAAADADNGGTKVIHGGRKAKAHS